MAEGFRVSVILIELDELKHALIFVFAGKYLKAVDAFVVDMMDGIVLRRTRTFHGRLLVFLGKVLKFVVEGINGS